MYGYALGNPLRYTDVFGEQIMVSVSFHDDVFYGHVTLWTDTRIFDPNGAECLCQIYEDAAPAYPGTGETYFRNPATDDAFRKHQTSGGWYVHNYKFNVPPYIEEEINRRIDEWAEDGTGPLGCASAVSWVLSGVGPFKNLGTTMWPSRLEDRLRETPQGGR